MAKAAPARKVTVRFLRPGPNLEGSAASYVFSDKVGRHCGYEVTETPFGIELRKGGARTLVPWSLVHQVEYSDG